MGQWSKQEPTISWHISESENFKCSRDGLYYIKARNSISMQKSHATLLHLDLSICKSKLNFNLLIASAQQIVESQ
jgi:hypothetical protein